jgi:5'-nucleotidase
VIVVACAVTLAALAGCSSDSKDSGSGSKTTTTTAAKAKELSILVSNDDGYSAEGISVLVEALRKLPNTKITVSAPADQKSGTGSKTVGGTPDTLTATDQKTQASYPAWAVNGFPVDSVNYGLAHMTEKPDVIIAGINEGQNLGPIAPASGTVGAATAGVIAGYPSLAASSGGGDPLDYPSAAVLVVDWVKAHRDAFVDGTAAKVDVNLNVPTCATGKVRGVKQVPLSPGASGALAVTGVPDCTSTATEFPGDVEAFLAGFATVTELNAEKQTVTTSTTWPASG